MKINNKQIGSLFVLIIALVSTNQPVLANSSQILINYSELLNALKNGNQVRAIIQLEKCSSSLKYKETNDAIGGMNFTVFNKYKLQVDNSTKRDVIATSINMLVKSSRYGFVNNYVRLHIFEDNSVEILSEFLDPKNYSSIKQTTFSCQLSNGKDKNAVILYNLS